MLDGEPADVPGGQLVGKLTCRLMGFCLAALKSNGKSHGPKSPRDNGQKFFSSPNWWLMWLLWLLVPDATSII